MSRNRLRESIVYPAQKPHGARKRAAVGFEIEEGMPVSKYVKKGYSMVISNGETQNI